MDGKLEMTGEDDLTLPDGSVGVNFSFHLVSSRNFSIVAHFPLCVVLHDSARFKEGARAALVKLLAL